MVLSHYLSIVSVKNCIYLMLSGLVFLLLLLLSCLLGLLLQESTILQKLLVLLFLLAVEEIRISLKQPMTMLLAFFARLDGNFIFIFIILFAL